jgi:hypothetical protein
MPVIQGGFDGNADGNAGELWWTAANSNERSALKSNTK